ncbi:MAG TPA: nicotinate-nucleotide--dimethylbenzimidazole phosphoribosyltransferase [Acidimicrobiia bacterium]
MSERNLARAIEALRPLDEAARASARAHHELLTKPPGSLGALEALGAQLAAISGVCPPPVPRSPAVAVFAADHGVAGAGVTMWPQDVTAHMVANFVAGGAAINALARQVGASVHVIDVGVAAELREQPAVRHHKVRPGTDNLADGPAMTRDDALAALDAGARVAAELTGDGHDLLVTGDMGIGNTTAAAALVAVLCDRAPAAVTGPGAGSDPATVARKTAVVAGAAERARCLDDPVAVLAEVGGLEIAAIAGFVVAGAAARVPVVVDGVITLAGLAVAEALAPGVAAHCVAGHRSPEPGAGAVLDHLGLDPLIDLGLRLGEGTGGCLAVPIVQSAARVLGEMATFADLGA